MRMIPSAVLLTLLALPGSESFLASTERGIPGTAALERVVAKPALIQKSPPSSSRRLLADNYNPFVLYNTGNNNNNNNNNNNYQVEEAVPAIIIDPEAAQQQQKLEEEEDDDHHVSVLQSFAQQYTLPESPDEIWLDKGQRMVTFGDVHGDYIKLRQFLEIAGVLAVNNDSDDDSDNDSNDDDCTWIGGNTVCVQCGDILDRGAQELECFRLLAGLGRQAVKQGGAVIVLHGNHEVMNADGDLRYVDPQGDLEFEAVLKEASELEGGAYKAAYQQASFHPNEVGKISRFLLMKPGGLLSAPLLQQCKVAVKVGRTVCVHAGLESHHVVKYGGIKGMNESAKQWFAGKGDIPECLYKEPVWMRTYSTPSDLAPLNTHAQRLIDDALTALNADRLVVGHTPQQRINSALRNKVWRVDVGASKGVMDGTPEVLQVIMDQTGREQVSVLTQSGPIMAKDRETKAYSIW